MTPEPDSSGLVERLRAGANSYEATYRLRKTLLEAAETILRLEGELRAARGSSQGQPGGAYLPNLDGGRRNSQAAFTKPSVQYPGYINVTREGDQVTVSVRADARDGECGPLVSLPMTWANWVSFLAEIRDRL
jgi:hypothetical protein